MIKAISSKVFPNSVPFPAIVSKQIITSLLSLFKISFNPSAILFKPVRVPALTCNPGCKTRFFTLKADVLLISFCKISFENLNIFSFKEFPKLIIYGA